MDFKNNADRSGEGGSDGACKHLLSAYYMLGMGSSWHKYDEATSVYPCFTDEEIKVVLKVIELVNSDHGIWTQVVWL